MDAILEAAHRILETSGNAGLTASAIAATAGVSVGSLYQYFPNKEAVLAALIEDRVPSSLDARTRAAEMLRGRTLRESIAVLVHALVAESRRRVGSYREIVYRAPALDRADLFVDRVRAWEELARELLEAHREEIRPAALENGPFLLARAVQGILHGLALERPALLSDERLGDEMVELVWRFVAGSPGRPV